MFFVSLQAIGYRSYLAIRYKDHDMIKCVLLLVRVAGVFMLKKSEFLNTSLGSC